MGQNTVKQPPKNSDLVEKWDILPIGSSTRFFLIIEYTTVIWYADHKYDNENIGDNPRLGGGLKFTNF